MPLKAQSEVRPRGRRRDQGGFVLLTLLFTAAAIAIQLAISLPRAAMEAQRIREEKLIYRGEQYKRAIELYYRKHQKYPQELDDLEDTAVAGSLVEARGTDEVLSEARAKPIHDREVSTARHDPALAGCPVEGNCAAGVLIDANAALIHDPEVVAGRRDLSIAGPAQHFNVLTRERTCQQAEEDNYEQGLAVQNCLLHRAWHSCWARHTRCDSRLSYGRTECFATHCPPTATPPAAPARRAPRR